MTKCAILFLCFLIFHVSRHFLVASQSRCSLRFSSESGIELQGFVYKSFADSELGSCFSKCLKDGVCQSINYDTQLLQCQFNNKTRRGHPEKVRPNKHGVYMENPKRAKKGSHPLLAGHSCKEINLGESRGDGEYWIDPKRTGQPFTVYCDMTTDSGGWTLIKRALLPTATPGSYVERKDYTFLSNYKDYRQIIYVPALKKLREDMGFHQIRFRCHKKRVNRTIHIMTTNNTAGHKVLDHFLVKPTWPTACNSFERLPDDTSILAQNCHKWGLSGSGEIEVNQWGKAGLIRYHRIYYLPMWSSKYVFSCFDTSAFYCDDNGGFYGALEVGDIWEVFVR